MNPMTLTTAISLFITARIAGSQRPITGRVKIQPIDDIDMVLSNTSVDPEPDIDTPYRALESIYMRIQCVRIWLNAGSRKTSSDFFISPLSGDRISWRSDAPGAVLVPPTSLTAS